MKNTNLKVEYIKVADLKPYERNSKIHDRENIEAIKKSIEKYGFNDAIGIWGKKNLVVEGHGRLIACKELGIEEVPCIRLDHLTEQERREYTLLHNKTTMMTDFNLDILTEELADLDLDDFQLDWGLPVDEEDADIVEDDFDIDRAIPEEPKATLGDIYQLGDHRLMCGSSTNAEDIANLFDGAMADLVVTDPPYNVDYSGKAELTGKGDQSEQKILNDNMEDEAFYNFLFDFYIQMNENLKEGGAYYIFHADSEGLNFRKALKDAGLQVRQTLIWVKNSLVLGRQDYQWRHEPCLYGWKEGAGHYFTNDRTQTTVIEDKLDLKKLKKDEMLKLLEEIFSEKVPSTIIYEDKPLRNDLHPTMKPIKLCARLIRNSSKPKQIVFDGFGGSGSTLIACEQLQRTCYMMELDPHYIDVIIKRWEDFTGKQAIKLNK